MYSRAQRGLWLNYPRRKYFDRNGSGASSTAAFIITSCSWLLIANDLYYFFWRPCCASRVPNGITEVTFVTAFSEAYTCRTRNLHWRNLAAWNGIMRTIFVRTFRFILLAQESAARYNNEVSFWYALLETTMTVHISCSVEPKIISALILPRTYQKTIGWNKQLKQTNQRQSMISYLTSH